MEEQRSPRWYRKQTDGEFFERFQVPESQMKTEHWVSTKAVLSSFGIISSLTRHYSAQVMYAQMHHFLLLGTISCRIFTRRISQTDRFFNPLRVPNTMLSLLIHDLDG
jgi:hypothetical protein